MGIIKIYIHSAGIPSRIVHSDFNLAEGIRRSGCGLDSLDILRRERFISTRRLRSGNADAYRFGLDIVAFI